MAQRAVALALVAGGMLAASAAAAGGSTRAVRSSWMSFPSGVVVRKIVETPYRDGHGKERGMAFVYAVEADAHPFDTKLVTAVREYLAAKYPGVPEVALGAWRVAPQGSGIASEEYRHWARARNGPWRREDHPAYRFAAPSAGATLAPLARDPSAEAAAGGAISTWLDALARRDLAACWAASDARLHGKFDEHGWRADATALLDRLGPLRDRHELAREYGGFAEDPARSFVTITYATTYGTVGEVLEEVSALACAPGGWCIAGWQVSGDELTPAGRVAGVHGAARRRSRCSTSNRSTGSPRWFTAW